MAEDVKVILGVDPSTESNVQGWFNGKTFDIKLKPDGDFGKQLEAAVKSVQDSVNKTSSKAMESAQAKATKSWTQQQAKELQQFVKAQEKAASDAQKALLQATNAKTLSNNMGNWLKSNTEYASKYGDEVKKLQERLEAAGKAGDSAAIKQVGAEFKELQSEAKDATTSITDLGTALKNALGGTVLGGIAKAGIGLMARELRQAAKEMVSSAVEIESALAQIQVVTGASGSQLDTFFDSAADSAKKFGVEVKDMLGSIETFSRLGLNLDDSLKLSETATMLGNIANMSVDNATNGLTSIIFGYGKSSADADHIADVVTKIGQAYAISGSEIMDSMTRVSAAASASNTSFEKTVALLAGGNAAMQDAAKTSTAIRTIMARVRGSKTELEDLGEELDTVGTGISKYREEIMALTNIDGSGGFDILEADGKTYKDVYDMLVGIADIWDQLDDISQARISEVFSGQRGFATFSSIIQNIDDVKAAYEDALNAAGTAAEANAIVMDTTEKKVEQLKTSFQVLARDVVSSDLTKGIVDFGTKAVDTIDSLVNKLGALPVALGGLGIAELIKNLGKHIAHHGSDSMAA